MRSHLVRRCSGGGLGVVLAAAVALGASAGASEPARGTVLSATPVLQQSRAELPGARYGADTYEVSYRTVGEDGRAATASGLVALPRDGGGDLRAVVYAGAGDRAGAALLAAAGYAAVVAPAGGAAAGVDLLRAARTLARMHSRRLDPGVLVAGPAGASLAGALREDTGLHPAALVPADRTPPQVLAWLGA
jgi:hypothetical protein